MMGYIYFGNEVWLSENFFWNNLTQFLLIMVNGNNMSLWYPFYILVDSFDVSTLSFYISQTEHIVLLTFPHRSYFVKFLPSVTFFKVFHLFSFEENSCWKLKVPDKMTVQICLILLFFIYVMILVCSLAGKVCKR